MDMNYTNLEKIFENLEKNALCIARKRYDYDLYDKFHKFGYYKDWKEHKFAIWIDVTDPRPGRSPFVCWEIRGEVFVDADGNKTYKMRFLSSNALNTEEYHPCTQTLAGMMREMEDERLKFIKGDYITFCNAATEQIIDSLP